MLEQDLLEGNKYFKWYWSICNRAKDRVLSPDTYVEKHHIYPKSIYGQNQDLVKLTAKEHYIVHLLLWWGLRTKYGTKDNNTIKMAGAFNCMRMISNDQKRIKIDSKVYELLKMASSESSIEYWSNIDNINNHSEKIKILWQNEDFKNKFLKIIETTEYKTKHKNGCKNNKFSKEAHKKSLDSRLGKKQSKETLDKRSISCSIAVEQYDLDNNFIKEYISAKVAKKETGANHITACCKGKMKHSKKFIWKYKDKPKI